MQFHPIFICLTHGPGQYVCLYTEASDQLGTTTGGKKKDEEVMLKNIMISFVKENITFQSDTMTCEKKKYYILIERTVIFWFLSTSGFFIFLHSDHIHVQIPSQNTSEMTVHLKDILMLAVSAGGRRLHKM